jgi:hypothetical protein
MLLVLLLLLILLAPLAFRATRALFVAQLCLICLFLPAGLLLKLGPGEDMRVYFGVSAVWGLLLLTGWRAWRRARAIA